MYFGFRRRKLAFALLAVFLMAGSYFSAFMAERDALPRFAGNVSVSGRISEMESSGNQTVYRLTEAVANGARVGDIRVTDYSGKGFVADDVIFCRGKLKRPEAAQDAFDFDNRLYFASIGVDYAMTAVEMEKIGQAADWRSHLNKLRYFIGERMEDLLGSKAPIGKAIFLGMDEDMSDKVVYDFRATGISHILCVSGLHVGIMAGLISFLLKKCNVRKKLSIVLELIVLFFYISLAGFKVSAIRAGVMCALAELAFYSARRPDSLTLLSAAFFLFVGANPAAIFDASLQLSFGAIFGILCVAPAVTRKIPKIGSALGSALGATLGTLPITLNLSNQFWLPSILLNVVVVAYGAVLIPLLFAATMLYCICPPLFGWIGGILQAMVGLLQSMSTGAALLPELVVNVKSVFGAVILALLGGLFLCSHFVNGKARWKAVAFGVILLPAIAIWAYVPKLDGQISVSFLDAGSGESALIATASGKHVLVDTSNGTGVASYLRKRGLKADVTVLTKRKTDHAGGLDALLEQNLSGDVYVSPESAELLGLKYTDQEFYGIGKGGRIPIDEDTALEIVYLNEEDSGLLALMLIYRGENLCLFMSDADKEDEKTIQEDVKSDIIVSGGLASPIIKLGRNGRATATSKEFLESVSPRLAVATSAGGVAADTGNVPVYDTKESGRVTLTWMDGEIKVETGYEG